MDDKFATRSRISVQELGLSQSRNVLSVQNLHAALEFSVPLGLLNILLKQDVEKIE